MGKRPFSALFGGALVLAVTFIVSCGGGDDRDQPRSQGGLRPKEEALAEKIIRDALAVGEAAVLGDLNVILSSVEPDPSSPANVIAKIRVENPTTDTRSAPNIGVVCEGNKRGEHLFLEVSNLVIAEDSYFAGEELIPRTFIERRALLSVPQGCANGVIQAEWVGAWFGGDLPSVAWALPE